MSHALPREDQEKVASAAAASKKLRKCWGSVTDLFELEVIVQLESVTIFPVPDCTVYNYQQDRIQDHGHSKGWGSLVSGHMTGEKDET